MARFLALSLRIFSLAAAASLPGVIMSLPADPANASPPPANGQPGVAATPSQDSLNRYGNIFQPGNGPAHPLKLALPFPDIGEIKVPSQNELAIRDKLESLAILSDDQIRDQISKWPPLAQMSLRDEAQFLNRIQDFRDHRVKIAQQAAHDLGLLTLNPQQQARFEKEYWDKRLALERDLAKQFEPALKQRLTQMNEDLYREFSLPASPPAQKPPLAAKILSAAAAQTAPAATNSAASAEH